jgi:phosphotriesterase-related protein
MGVAQPYEHERMLQGIKELVEAGLAEHIVLSQDVCWRTDYVAYGGRGYAFVATGLREELRRLGIGDEAYHRMTVDNPRRALTGEP